MTAPEIAAALGCARRSGAWWRCRCPVHGSRGPTLGEILAELWRRGLIAGRGCDARAVPKQSGRPKDTAQRLAMARRLWEGAQDVCTSPAARYLRSRHIKMPPPPSLRWAPACRHPSGRTLPAMLARINAVDGELIGIHRTYLRPDDWGKADIEPAKAMLGRAAGGAVRLAEPCETLMIGEGIETCLATMQATGLPGWAALSTSGLVALRLPAIVRTLIILADNDESGAGERAAYAAADRWLAEGRRVRIVMPPERGTDMADVLMASGFVEGGDAVA